uniref:Uncharacterized protein n=1 Tax=Arundo donax TaxID=35708 RepID=A0A0A9D4Q5_ARUDO
MRLRFVKVLLTWTQGLHCGISLKKKKEYYANNPKDNVDQENALDDDVKILSTWTDTKKGSKRNMSSKKRGRPRKNGENTKPATPEISPESAKTIAQCVQGKQCRASIQAHTN